MNRYQKNLIASSQHLSGLFREILSNSATYLRLSPSFSLENNFSLVDLKYSPKFMTTKSSLRHQSRFLIATTVGTYNIMLIIGTKLLPD